MKTLLLLILLSFNLFSTSLFAAKKDQIYGSLKFSKINSRGGPGLDFPVVYSYILENMPVRIIGEYDKWFKIMDKDGDIGWVSEHLISKKRTVIVINNEELLYSSSSKESYPTHKIEKNVVAKLIKCKKNRCKIKVGDVKGWINKTSIWGY